MATKRWVNYHHLLYFKTIATEGGLAKASKKLRLGQPTLSTQMKQFEDVLGHSLFDRSKRHLQLTDAGRLVLGYANEIFKMGDEMLDALNDQYVANKIQVQIGAADTVAKHIILKIFHFCQQKYKCIVSITEGHGDDLLRELNSHRIDLVISNNPPPVGGGLGLYSKSIAKIPVVVCGTHKYHSLQSDFPASLNGQPFILPVPQSKLRQDIEHFLDLNQIRVAPIAEVQDTSLQKIMATHGDGLVPVSSVAVEDLIKDKSLISIGTIPGVYDEIWFISAKRHIQNPVASSVMKEFSF